MNATHAPSLVALSILIAICASYTALTLAGRVSVARGRARVAWLLGGSVAMGSGIWSMHFVAMLAFHLPVGIAYDVPLVTLSFLAAVGASAFALFVASRSTVGTGHRIAAGFCLGAAVVAMHYTGMAAVRVPAQLTYDPLLVVASVLIAIAASTVALWLFLWLRNDNTRRGRALRAIAAVVMGLAIAGMHYTAMAAAHFSVARAMPPMHEGFLIGTTGLAVPVVMGAFVILTLTLAGSVTDRWVRTKLAAAEALRESEERYRSVVNEIDEVIFRTDETGRWTFLNPAWTAITGFTIDETLGREIHDCVAPSDRAALVEQYRVLREGLVDYSRIEVRCCTTGQESRWVELHARTTRGDAGVVVGTAGVIRDITDRHRAEEALRAARETAEAASRAKNEFLSRMSHELRTPLNAILGFGQLIELDADTPGLRESGDQILKAGRHLLALIDEVLDITQIESGRLHLSTEPVCVGEVAREIVDLIAPLATARRIALSYDATSSFKISNISNISDISDISNTPDAPDGAGRFVHADRQRLKQVLLNLVANAVKYNRDGGHVRVACEGVAGGRLRLVVEDSGPGIAAEKLPRLFTPFDRLGAEQLGVEGTGLGLALSKRLAEAMGGSIGVRSEVGTGSAFWIELPDAENPLSQVEQVGHAEPPTRGGASSRTRRILYVEDNLSNLTLVQRILARHHDIELIPAMQGGLALELARTHRPDLVLLDLHLPDIPGEEVLKQLRAAADCRGIPIVVLSADATRGQIDRLIAAGAHAYVTKPLVVQPFIDMINDAMNAERAA
jgi:PAS domain S-box-containing protein